MAAAKRRTTGPLRTRPVPKRRPTPKGGVSGPRTRANGISAKKKPAANSKKDRLDGLTGAKRKAAVKEVFDARKAKTKKALDGTSGAERKARYKSIKADTRQDRPAAKSKKRVAAKAAKQSQAKRNSAARSKRAKKK